MRQTTLKTAHCTVLLVLLRAKKVRAQIIAKQLKLWLHGKTFQRIWQRRGGLKSGGFIRLHLSKDLGYNSQWMSRLVTNVH
jgi:hypothetical protein